MTRNEIAWLEALEHARSNRATELETNRANLARETETRRLNDLTHNETVRHNKESEGQQSRDLLEKARQHNERLREETRRNSLTDRTNLLRQGETVRANRASEFLKLQDINQRHEDSVRRSRDAIAQARMRLVGVQNTIRDRSRDRASNERIAFDRNAIQRDMLRSRERMHSQTLRSSENEGWKKFASGALNTLGHVAGLVVPFIIGRK